MSKRSLRSRLPLIGGLLFMAAFTGGVIWLVVGFINSADKPEPARIQTISLVKPPPPPPPKEKPPEPEKIDKPKEEVKLDQPKEQPPEEAAPPPGGIPDGPAGGMATDLARGSGIGIGGGGDRSNWYGQRIARQMEDDLKRAKALQGKEYRVVALLWFNAAGAVTQVRLDNGSGNAAVDDILRSEMLRMTLRDPLPSDIPQPVKLRVVSR